MIRPPPPPPNTIRKPEYLLSFYYYVIAKYQHLARLDRDHGHVSKFQGESVLCLIQKSNIIEGTQSYDYRFKTLIKTTVQGDGLCGTESRRHNTEGEQKNSIQEAFETRCW